jgi:hypothetical protein
VKFPPFPVKIFTSVLTIGHCWNKTFVLGLQTTTCICMCYCIAFAKVFVAAEARTSLQVRFILIQIISRTGGIADRWSWRHPHRSSVEYKPIGKQFKVGGKYYTEKVIKALGTVTNSLIGLKRWTGSNAPSLGDNSNILQVLAYLCLV